MDSSTEIVNKMNEFLAKRDSEGLDKYLDKLKTEAKKDLLLSGQSVTKKETPIPTGLSWFGKIWFKFKVWLSNLAKEKLDTSGIKDVKLGIDEKLTLPMLPQLFRKEAVDILSDWVVLENKVPTRDYYSAPNFDLNFRKYVFDEKNISGPDTGKVVVTFGNFKGTFTIKKLKDTLTLTELIETYLPQYFVKYEELFNEEGEDVELKFEWPESFFIQKIYTLQSGLIYVVLVPTYPLRLLEMWFDEVYPKSNGTLELTEEDKERISRIIENRVNTEKEK